MQSVVCEHLQNGTCRIATELARGLPVVADPQACAACCNPQHCSVPQTDNWVTASLAIHTHRKAGDAAMVERLSHDLADILYRGRRVVCGPGCHLHRLLLGYGIRPRHDCGCEEHTLEMDRQGAEWCRANVETIVDWLMEEALQRHFLGVFPRVAPGAARTAARKLVLQAIVLAEGEQP